MAVSASGQTVVGLYPTFPPKGPLTGKGPQEQAGYLRSIGVTLAGGRFTDAAVPDALREAGIQSAGLVVLFQGEQHWKSHPESRPIMADGKPLFKDRWYAGLCPNQPYLRQEKLAEIERMLASGWYDYINLDFIRYPVHWEVPSPRIPDTCYDPVCLDKFQRDTGVTIPAELTGVPEKAAWIKANHGEAWYKWRADQITSFCADVKRLRDRISPKTLIGVAAVPWRPDDYDNAIHNVVAQDFAELAKVVDIFNPMSYHVLNDRPVTWIGEVTAYLVERTGRPVWPFVIFAREKPLSAEEWRTTFRQALANGSEGLIAFPFDRAAETEGYEIFQELFR